MNKLHKFWFQFEASSKPNVLNLGCGVTALSYDDALRILKDRIFAEKNFPGIVGCIEDVTQHQLDPKHVLPNMGNIEQYGVWFPLGYQLG